VRSGLPVRGRSCSQLPARWASAATRALSELVERGEFARLAEAQVQEQAKSAL
jgi:hypothetical protein